MLLLTDEVGRSALSEETLSIPMVDLGSDRETLVAALRARTCVLRSWV